MQAVALDIVTVHQLEAGTSMTAPSDSRVLGALLKAAGVEFIDENGGGPGVRLRHRARPRAPKT